MDDMDLNLYVLAELHYMKEHEGEEGIFPADWYSTRNYKLKTEIIAEAVKKKIKVKDTDLYRTKMLEGVKE